MELTFSWGVIVLFSSKNTRDTKERKCQNFWRQENSQYSRPTIAIVAAKLRLCLFWKGKMFCLGNFLAWVCDTSIPPAWIGRLYGLLLNSELILSTIPQMIYNSYTPFSHSQVSTELYWMAKVRCGHRLWAQPAMRSCPVIKWLVMLRYIKLLVLVLAFLTDYALLLCLRLRSNLTTISLEAVLHQALSSVTIFGIKLWNYTLDFFHPVGTR